MVENFLNNANFFLIFSFLVLVAFSVLLSDVLKRKIKNIHEEILRKLPHILIGIVFIISPFFLSRLEIIFLSVILLLGVSAGKYLPIFKAVFSIKRVTFGMWLAPLSLGLMAFLWLPENISAFIFGMSVFAFSDSLAALFGRLYGKKKIPHFSKTFLGSAVFFITTFSIATMLAEKNNFLIFGAVAFLLTTIELILTFGLDNLLLPIAASYFFDIFL